MVAAMNKILKVYTIHYDIL